MAALLNLAHWRLLVAIADTGNLSRAALDVGITQSGASQALAQLETDLGVQVFVRERRGMRVTALGETVVAHARHMLDSLRAIRTLAAESRGLGNARVRLASFPSVISAVIAPRLTAFRQRHPGIEVIAIEGTDVEVETWLADDAIDVGVVLNPPSSRHALTLGQDAWVGLVPTSHPLGRRASRAGVTLAEMATLPFILATGGCHVNAQQLMTDAGLTLTDIRVTVRDWASACVLVREGLGVAIVPASTVPDDLRGVRRLALQPTIHRRFGLAASQAGAASPAVQAFLQAMAQAA